MAGSYGYLGKHMTFILNKVPQLRSAYIVNILQGMTE